MNSDMDPLKHDIRSIGLKGIIANLLTCCRIILSLIMICFPVFSVAFYACYFMAGITDMVDGTIARRLGTESKFGEKLDTIADIILAVSALYKLLPAVKIKMFVWIWIGVIAVIKVINIISGFALQKRFVTVHSVANKMVGLILFVLTFSIHVIDIRYSSVVACLFATFAAIQEGYFIRNEVLNEKE